MNMETLKELAHITVLFNACLKDFTHTKTGGIADLLALPKTKEDVIKLVKCCKNCDIPWYVIGNGSNLIISDGGIHGMVIVLTEMNKISVHGQQIAVQAGAKLIDTSYIALAYNLTGLEFACGIPGSVGGAIYMNAGAYGGEIKDVFTSAEVLFSDGSVKTLSNQDLRFTYRHSAIQEMQCVVLQATFLLKEGNREAIKMTMDDLTSLREAKQPLEYPSCGSVFKRPPGHFAGKLIQDAGLQGLKLRGAQVSEKHAGFIVNVNHATATDYIQLIRHIQRIVKEKFDVVLETEVRIIGEKI